MLIPNLKAEQGLQKKMETIAEELYGLYPWKNNELQRNLIGL